MGFNYLARLVGPSFVLSVFPIPPISYPFCIGGWHSVEIKTTRNSADFRNRFQFKQRVAKLMKPQYLILPIVLSSLLAFVYLLPKTGEMSKSAVEMDLPKRSGTWEFRPQPASKVEIETLAPDTEFSKAICFSARQGEFDLATGMAVPDRLDLSIVLSGHDLNNSIHRPERCMPSQGHVITNSSDLEIELPNGRNFKVKRLLSVQSIPINQEQTEHKKFSCVTYYFFVGHHRITQDHLARTLLDMKDRLLLGMDQRWAYVSTSMWYGKMPWIEEEITIAEADTKLKQFLVDFGETQIDWELIKN